jgi:hypothetical protein
MKIASIDYIMAKPRIEKHEVLGDENSNLQVNFL